MMRKILMAAVAAAALAIPSVSFAADVPAAASGTVVNVTLSDSGENAHEQNMKLGIGMNADLSKATMFVKADTFAVKAGLVTFKVQNASAHHVHELLVVPVASMDKPLPYEENEQQVDEDDAGSLGEVADLDPGKSGEMTLDLKPGLYAMFCNIPGHYMAGMWRVLAVQQ